MNKEKLTLNTVQNIKVVEELVPRYAHFLYPQPSALQLPEQNKVWRFSWLQLIMTHENCRPLQAPAQ